MTHLTMQVATQRAATLLAHVAFSFVALSATGKLLALHDFHAQVAEWAIVPAWARTSVAVTIPAAELWICLDWFRGAHRDRSLVAALLLVLTVTIATHLEGLVAGSPPECACMGVWNQYFEKVAATGDTITRNTLLILLLSLSGVVRTGFRWHGSTKTDQARE